jgi:hypothetical protein
MGIGTLMTIMLVSQVPAFTKATSVSWEVWDTPVVKWRSQPEDPAVLSVKVVLEMVMVPPAAYMPPPCKTHTHTQWP